MTFQDIIALAIVAVAVVYAGRSLWRTLHGETGCAGECGCAAARPREAAQEDGSLAPPTLKRIPLVTLEEVGKPTSTSSSTSSAA